MKYMKRANIYHAANYKVIFNPTTLEAYSYKWWKFVAMVEGQLVFNNYRYSSSTSIHQSKVRNLLSQLGIKIDVEMPLPEGIKSHHSFAEMVELAEIEVCNKFLRKKLKAQDQYHRAKAKKLEKSLLERKIEAV